MSAPTTIKYHGRIYKRAADAGERRFAIKGGTVNQFQDGRMVHRFLGDYLNSSRVLRAMAEWLDNKNASGAAVSFGHVQQAVLDAHDIEIGH